METSTLTSFAAYIATLKGKEDDASFLSTIKLQGISYIAEIVKQRINRSGFIHPNYIQTIKCIKLKTILEEECSFDLKEKTVLKIVSSLPKPLSYKAKMPFVGVYNTMQGKNRINIPFVDVNNIEYLNHSQFTKNRVHYTYDNGDIFLINTEKEFPIDAISVRGVFENPYQALQYAKQDCGCCEDCNNIEQTCFTEDEDYIIDTTILALLPNFYGINNNRAEES